MTASVGEGRRISFDTFEKRFDWRKKFGLKYDLSQCMVYLISGDGFRGYISGFQDLGVQIRTRCDV